MKWKKVPQKLIDFLEENIKPCACEQKKRFGCPAYFVKNNMFTGAHQESLFLRLNDKDRHDLLNENYKVLPFEPMPGRIMREYVVIPESLYSNSLLFKKWLEKSYAYVSILPEKTKGKTR